MNEKDENKQGTDGMLKSRERQILVTPAVRAVKRRCNKVAEQQQQGKNTQASLLFLILQVSCSRNKISKYG